VITDDNKTIRDYVSWNPAMPYNHTVSAKILTKCNYYYNDEDHFWIEVPSKMQYQDKGKLKQSFKN